MSLATPEHAVPRRVASKRLVLAVAVIGSFMAYLDSTVVNLAFPSIARSFPGETRATLSWVLDGYFIVFAAFLVPAGRLGDRLGQRRMLLAGMATFTVASGVCAVAPSPGVLIAARLVQAFGASIVSPTSLSLLLARVPSVERPGAVAAWGAGAGAAAAVGPSIGGLLVAAGDWRWIFLVNLPFGIVAFLLGRHLDERVDRAEEMPDLVGATLFALGIGALAFSIVERERYGWGSALIIGAFVLAVVLVVAVVERSRRHPVPLLDVRLLRERPVALANGVTLLFGMALYGLIFCNVLFLTTVWGYSILHAGLAVTPGAVLALACLSPSRQMMLRFGPWVPARTGLAVVGLGAAFYLVRVGLRPNYVTGFLPGNMLTGIGIGISGPGLAAAAVAWLGPERFGIGAALNSAARQLGAALGVASVVAIIGTPQLLDARAAFDGAWAFTGGCALSGVLLLVMLKRALRL